MCHGSSAARFDDIRGYLVERDENESAFGQPGVGNFEAWKADVEVVEEQDVEVKGSRAIGDPRRAVAAEFELDCQQSRKQLLRVEIGFEC